jgi:hypothetical protein
MTDINAAKPATAETVNRLQTDQLGGSIKATNNSGKRRAQEAIRAPFVIVYAGTQCIGFAMNRGPMGLEAIGADDISRGFFTNIDAAATALAKSGGEQ